MTAVGILLRGTVLGLGLEELFGRLAHWSAWVPTTAGVVFAVALLRRSKAALRARVSG